MKTERTQIHFLSDVLVAVASLDLEIPNERLSQQRWFVEVHSLVTVGILGTLSRSASLS